MRERIKRLKRAWKLWGPKLKYAWNSDSKEITNHTYPITSLNRLYMVHLVAHVTNRPVEEIEGYFDEIENDNALKQHVITRLAEGPWAHASDPRFDPGRRMAWYAIARATKPEIIIESGCERGLGSVCLITALQRNSKGHFYGLDINQKAGWLIHEKYEDRASVIYGDAISNLEKFSKPINMFVEDSCHTLEFETKLYNTIEDKLTSDAVIIGDNCHCCPALEKFSRKTNRDFLFMHDEPIHWQIPAGVGIAWRRTET